MRCDIPSMESVRPSTLTRPRYVHVVYLLIRPADEQQPFHTDNYTDIVSLHVYGNAASGGAFKVASTWMIYNELRNKRPDLLKVLAADWVFDRYVY
jgi:hypothetical protein